MTDQEPRRADRELADYVEATQESPSPGFTEWVMRSVAGEPLPRRGALASLAALMTLPGPYRRAAQVMALALILVAGIGSAAVVGSLIDEPSPSPGPTVEPSSEASPSVTPPPSPSPVSTPAPPSPTPTESPESPEPTETPEPGETPDASDD
jgi:hypothetical protein